MIILLLNFLFFELHRIFCPNHFFIFLSMIFFSKIMKKFQPQKMSFKQDFLLLRFFKVIFNGSRDPKFKFIWFYD